MSGIVLLALVAGAASIRLAPFLYERCYCSELQRCRAVTLVAHVLCEIEAHTGQWTRSKPCVWFRSATDPAVHTVTVFRPSSSRCGCRVTDRSSGRRTFVTPGRYALVAGHRRPDRSINEPKRPLLLRSVGGLLSRRRALRSPRGWLETEEASHTSCHCPRCAPRLHPHGTHTAPTRRRPPHLSAGLPVGDSEAGTESCKGSSPRSAPRNRQRKATGRR